MTESNAMFQEMVRVHDSLSGTAMRTKDKIDSRMRATVKEVINDRLIPVAEPAKKVRQGRELRMHFIIADAVSDALLGMDSSKQMQFMKNMEEWNRTRPVRIYNYVLKLVDIFPAEHLTQLLRDSLSHDAEETIRIYEPIKGEARSKDYSCEPTQIDPSSIKPHDASN